MKERRNIMLEDWQFKWLPKQKSQGLRHIINTFILKVKGKKIDLPEPDVQEELEYKAKQLTRKGK